MLSPFDVTAVIVTKGNVSLAPVIESLIFDEIIVWDNSIERNEMTYGRVLGAARARNSVIYSQDDDIIHTPKAQAQLVAAYDPDCMTGCMWPEWSDGAREQGIENGYDDLVFPGSGSITHRDLWDACISEYLAEYALDDFFRLWCDTILGIICPTRQLDIRFDALTWAEDEDRMCNLENAVALKTEAIRRGRQIRDGVPA